MRRGEEERKKVEDMMASNMRKVKVSEKNAGDRIKCKTRVSDLKQLEKKAKDKKTVYGTVSM